jgi:hypothetical protein
MMKMLQAFVFATILPSQLFAGEVLELDRPTKNVAYIPAQRDIGSSRSWVVKKVQTDLFPNNSYHLDVDASNRAEMVLRLGAAGIAVPSNLSTRISHVLQETIRWCNFVADKQTKIDKQLDTISWQANSVQSPFAKKGMSLTMSVRGNGENCFLELSAAADQEAAIHAFIEPDDVYSLSYAMWKVPRVAPSLPDYSEGN